VVFCVVNRSGFVVKTWLETTANSTAKIFQLFEIYFWRDEAGRVWVREADFSAALLTVKLSSFGRNDGFW